MENLINITYGEDQPTVSARELHEQLHIGTAFKDWFPRMTEYGFTENEDFNVLKIERVQKEGNREVRREITDYNITVDMAKQICMIQRTPEGKAVRQYLLDLEKVWNSPDQVMSRALKMADRTINKLKETERKASGRHGANETERNFRRCCECFPYIHSDRCAGKDHQPEWCSDRTESVICMDA